MLLLLLFDFSLPIGRSADGLLAARASHSSRFESASLNTVDVSFATEGEGMTCIRVQADLSNVVTVRCASTKDATWNHYRVSRFAVAAAQSQRLSSPHRHQTTSGYPGRSREATSFTDRSDSGYQELRSGREEKTYPGSVPRRAAHHAQLLPGVQEKRSAGRQKKTGSPVHTRTVVAAAFVKRTSEAALPRRGWPEPGYVETADEKSRAPTYKEPHRSRNHSSHFVVQTKHVQSLIKTMDAVSWSVSDLVEVFACAVVNPPFRFRRVSPARGV